MRPRSLALLGGGLLLLSLLSTLLSSRVLGGSPVVPGAGVFVVNWLTQVSLYVGSGLVVVAALVHSQQRPPDDPDHDCFS